MLSKNEKLAEGGRSACFLPASLDELIVIDGRWVLKEKSNVGVRKFFPEWDCWHERSQRLSQHRDTEDTEKNGLEP